MVIAPAPGRPLPPGGSLPGRLQRDQPGRHRRLRQRRSRPGCAPASTWPTTASLLTPAEEGVPDAWWSTCAPWGSSPFTGKPYHPTAQGKNERFGQALFRYLDQQLLAAFIVELQEQVDRFDLIYNSQRPHQGLPGRASPRSRPGTPPRWPRRPDRTVTPPLSPQEAQPLSRTPPHGAGCVGTSPSVPPDSAS